MKTLNAVCKNIQKNVSFKNLTTMRVGGTAKYVAFPSDEKELIQLIEFLSKKHKRYFILGNGSNVLPPDKKYKGVIIKLNNFNSLAREENLIHAGSGVKLISLINFAIENGLKGLEDASGIPATVGGAVKMNSGAFNFEISKVIKRVTILRGGKIISLENCDCGFEYRKSGFYDTDIILAADFVLEYGDKEELISRQREVLEKRQKLPKQPSLGSIFKRQEGLMVSKLLDEMKFKGVTFGGAMVSREHAGIIVNTGDATSEDVRELINYIKKRCLKEKNITLVEEIKYLNL